MADLSGAGGRDPVCDATSYAHPRLRALIARAQAAASGALAPIAVAHPADAHALRAAAAMANEGLARPLLVGGHELILRAAEAAQLDVDAFEVVATSADPKDAAARAVALARDGSAMAVMKGSLHTDELLGAIAQHRTGLLQRGTRLSHAFVFDLPRYPKLLALADCVVNVEPKLRVKHDIVANALLLLRALGVTAPKVAVVAAVETVMDTIPATVDARALAEAAQRGEFGDARVEGPFGFDNAFSAEAARIKGLKSEVAGDADLLLMPDLNSGNILYKSFVYAGGAECAGLLLGVKAPVILISRADSQLARLASVALAVLVGRDGALAAGR